MHSERIHTPVQNLPVTSPLRFGCRKAVHIWDFRYLLMHHWVRLTWYFCKLWRHEFLTNDVPTVIQRRKMAFPDIVGGLTVGLCKCFTVCQWGRVDSKLLQSQYRTSLERQHESVSTPYSQDRFIGHCAWAAVVCDWLCLKLHMPLSHYPYVAILIYQWWNCHQNQLAQLTIIYDSQHASLDVQKKLHAVRWFSPASERQWPSTKLQTQSSR